MRGDQWGRGFEGLLTWQGRSKAVAIKRIETVTTTSTSKLFRIWLEPREQRRDPMLGVSYGRYGPDDLTEIGLRVALLGERNPLEDQHLGFAADLPNPLQLLRERHLSEEIVRPIAGLLLTDTLVGSGRASRLVRLALGVPIGRRRKIVLKWRGVPRISNEEPKEFELSGEMVFP
jgi:hypothetical protein